MTSSPPPCPVDPPGAFGWLHPRDEAAVQRLVRAARAAGQRIRVRGAGHSTPPAIAGDGDCVVLLDRLRHLRYDDTTGEVTAGAGVRFGLDTADPRRADGTALCPWLQARGRALPNLGGILHQTAVGFLSTGSGGGSTRYDLAAAVVALRLVDGTGEVHVLRRGTDDDLLDAVLVSVGACGIITEVTFRTEPSFDVAGTETMSADRGGALDLFADDDTGLAAHLTRTDYARILWWPQRAVRRIVSWEARRVAPDSTIAARAYRPMPALLGSTQPAQIVAGALLWGMVHWRGPVRRLGAGVAAAAERMAAPIEGALYRAFTTAEPQHFRGPWWTILPQDAEMDERWMPTTFTELFVPLARAGEVMRRLDALFDADPGAAGCFAIELYAAPPSRAWLHPSYGRPSLRVNVFWLMHSPIDPRDAFLARIWEVLSQFDSRLHWGKLFPHEPASAITGRFPRNADFLATRARLDPDGIFLTTWLRTALGLGLGLGLGLAGATTRPDAPLPRHRVPKQTWRWPLWFEMRPATLGTLAHADKLYDLSAIVATTPSAAIAAFFDDETTRTVRGLNAFIWHAQTGDLDGAVLDVSFACMTMRMRTVEYRPGVRLAMSLDRCTLPLGAELLLILETEPHPGGCLTRCRVAAHIVPRLALAAPLGLAILRRLLARVLHAVQRRFTPPA